MTRGAVAFGLGDTGDHLVSVEKPSLPESGGNLRLLFRGVLPAGRRSGAFWATKVALAHGIACGLRRYMAPSRIAGAGKKLALAFGLSASLVNASQYETASTVELLPANSAFEHRAVHAVGTRTWTWTHAVSIEKPGELGETLNFINGTLYQTLSQYRAEPLLKSAEGVTTSAWSLTRESGTAVKRHEPPARKGRDSLSCKATCRSVDKEPRDNTTDSDWDTLNIAASDVISSAEYQWRQIALNVVSSGRELRINSGESRIINLAKAKLKNAIHTYNNNFSSDIYSSGSLSNQVNGLQALIADAGTGQVGGINSSVWTFWQNEVQSAAAPLQGGSAITPGPTTIESLMLPLWLNLDRGPDDQTDLIVMSNDYYTFFEQSQTSLKRYLDKDMADAGFVGLMYKNAPVLFDGGSGIPTAHAYFINTRYLELVSHRDADLDVMDEIRPVNQDGVVVTILWMGNLTLSNRNRQGVMKA